MNGEPGVFSMSSVLGIKNYQTANGRALALRKASEGYLRSLHGDWGFNWPDVLRDQPIPAGIFPHPCAAMFIYS